MDKRTQWHPGFCSALRLVFKDYWSVLEFEDEYQLTDKPMQIDCVVIKKKNDMEIDNDIGRILKTHNLFEYKSPDDEMNIDTFYKAIGYACAYKSSARHVDEISASSITITMITSSNEDVIEKWKESDPEMCETMIKIMANELEESKQQGMQQGMCFVAEKMLRANKPAEEIKTFTGISIENLKELANKLGVTLVL